ncbi:MAG: bifunctional metallophosphatase/5'-nucleotidase [Alphaproteobacteria bacterium]|nr:bifunctional metallophosphatase/5'-nucleotidase [Alphaproteobacteria bacterium]
MRWRPILLALLLALPAGAVPAEEFRLTLLHSNDVHGRHLPANPLGAGCRPQDVAENACFGGAARLAAAVARLRRQAANLLLLDAGDQFQGTLFYAHYKGRAEATLMRRLGYDAMAAGNHEFDDGPQVFGRFILEVGLPVLAANLDASGEPALAERLRPHVLLQRGGRSIGIVGYVTEDTPVISSPGPRVRFLPIEPALERAVGQLTAAGADIIVALGHAGLARDREIVRRVAGLDIVVGGHSHSLLSNREPGAAGPYPVVERGPTGQPVLVVQAGAWGRYLGRLEVAFDAAGVPGKWQGEPLLLDAGIAPDAEVAALVAELDRPLQALRSETIGEAAEDFALAGCLAGECAIGNLVAEAMLWAGRTAWAEVTVQNGGGIRAGLPKGPLSRGQVMEMLPFANTLALFKLKGSDLRAAIEGGLGRVGQGSGAGRFPQVAGLGFAFDPTRPPGERLSALSVGGEPLRPERLYTIVTNSFLRRGGDDYRAFAERAVEPYDHGQNLDEAVIAYLAAHRPVAPRLDGRVQRAAR